MTLTTEDINTQLSAGERVLWSGQPRQGVIIRGADALMIPFSLLWGSFAIFWELSVINSNAPAFFALFGIPFVLVGIYLIIGRFFFEARHRARTYYAVTNERILIISGLSCRKVQSLDLRTLSDLSLSEGKGNEGTITFGSGSPFNSMFGGFSSWPGTGAYLGPRFELVANAKTIFETIRRAQRAAASART